MVHVFIAILLLSMSQMLACSGNKTSGRSAAEGGATNDASDADSASVQSGISPGQITGTNLTATTFSKVTYESGNWVVPLVTGDRPTKDMGPNTRFVIAKAGASPVTLAMTAGKGLHSEPYLRFQLPSGFPAGTKVSFVVSDEITGQRKISESSIPSEAGTQGGGQIGTAGVHRIFLTAQRFRGDLVSYASGMNGTNGLALGIAAADYLCDCEATQAGLSASPSGSGKFKAVISMQTFSARDRFSFSGPVREVGQTTDIAKNAAEFFDTAKLGGSILRGSNGLPIIPGGTLGEVFWAGASSTWDGAYACGNWQIMTSDTPGTILAARQLGPSDYGWIEMSTSCDAEYPLLCLEE